MKAVLNPDKKYKILNIQSSIGFNGWESIFIRYDMWSKGDLGVVTVMQNYFLKRQSKLCEFRL